MPEVDERQAFIDAVVKLADDADFRKAFLYHYQLFLHPPIAIHESARIEKFIDGGPGSITRLSDEEMQAHLEGKLVFVAR